jgi:choline dehydrogenase
VYQSRPNLRIVTDSTVTRIEWRTRRVRGKKVLIRPLVAEGVFYITNALTEPTVSFATVRRDVIISAGGMITPKILMISGIGPSAHLTTRGIPVLVASEQVGRNLQDHISLPTMSFRFQPPTVTDRVITSAFGRSGLRDDHILDYEIAFVQAANTPAATIVVSIPVMTRNSGNGSVQLLDSNPSSLPLVDFATMSTPRDILTLAWLGNRTRAIAMQTPGYITESAPGFTAVPLGAPLSAWNAWFQSTAPFFGARSYAHFSGTCRMASSIETGVVDGKLKVFGTANVRAADMSVIPQTVSQRPFGTGYLVGERVADFALNDRLLSL